MYDVNFGGKRMTKRLTIALVALVALVLAVVLPASASLTVVNNTVNNGATVFIGEQGLDLTPAMTTYANPTSLGWWASAASLTTTSPTTSIALTNPSSFYVSSASFVGYTGNWYAINPSTGYANTTSGAFFNVKDPSVAAKVWDFSTGIDVSGGSVIQGDYLGFRIDTNLNEALTTNRTSTNNAVPGNADIKVKSDSGNTYNALYNGTSGQIYSGSNKITAQVVTLPSWYFGTTDHQYPATNNKDVVNWSTGVLDASGQQAYPTGTYTVTIESLVNGMKDNYKNGGADYTGKTVSQAATVTIVSNTVKIEANKDSVVRSKPFSVTITGKPNAMYHVWIKGTTSMDGTYDNQPPMIAQNQAGVYMDNALTVSTDVGSQTDVVGNSAYAGRYVFQNAGSIVNLWNNVAHGTTATRGQIGNGTYLYANVSLNDQGTRTVQWVTTNWTKAQKYTIRVEQNFSGQYKSDEVDVKIEKGAVTIVAAGDQSYYLGEEIKFSGTNTESQNTYLFITGPNLKTVGSSMNTLDPRSLAVEPGNDGTYVIASVNGDNTWSYKWGTASVALDAGTYTIYATSQEATTDSDSLANVAYGTVSIVIKKPFVSATVSQSTVAQGDNVYITGTAEGQPSSGVNIWILGKNYGRVYSESVNSDASFSYEVKKADTKTMYTGQYFVVVQHPMQNDQFDVYANPTPQMATSTSPSIVYTKNQSGGSDSTVDFKLSGSGSLQGSDAAEALVEAINDANVDDTYTKLQFLVEVPVINIDTIGDRHVGDKFTITATTNLAIDDEVLFEVYSSSFQPTQKSQSGEFSGATGTVKVTKGDSGLNKLSFDVDASTFKPDEYLVTATAVLQDATGTALFNVLEASTTTATPSVTATAVTTAPVTTVTTVPVTTATPTKTPTQPGFGALVALIGLGAVALLVVRKH
jgi:PGF-CTERM protein